QGLGPLHMPTGWRLMQLESKVQVSPDLTALDDNARMKLQQQGLDLARERRLNELVDQLRGSFPVEIHPERLKRVPWPVPAGSRAPSPPCAAPRPRPAHWLRRAFRP